MEAADLELFARSLSHALVGDQGWARDAALEAAGWHDALSLEPQTAVSILFELQGAANATSAALDQVLAAAARFGDRGPTCVLLPWLGDHEPPGRLAGGEWHIRGLASRSIVGREALTVLARQADGRVVVLEVSPSELDRRQIGGLDPALGLSELSGTVALSTPAMPLDDAAWDRVVSRGSLAIGHELVGAGRAMLELARSHSLERVQFGVTISTFQAVRHRLADALVAVESASALLVAAWEDGTPLTSSMAKAYAGRSARLAAGHCQRAPAGMGFTAEHPFHHHLRRVMVLDQLFGSSARLTRQLGADLLEQGGLPALFPL